MYTDFSLIVRAKENILGINKWLNSLVTKKFYLPNIFPQGKQFMPNPLQFLDTSLFTIIYNTTYCPLYYDECRQYIINCSDLLSTSVEKSRKAILISDFGSMR